MTIYYGPCKIVNMRRHPKKEVQAGIEYGEGHGWRFEPAGKGHAWAKGYCACGECRIFVVYSTPQNPGNHAKRLRQAVDKCPASG